VKSPAVPAPIVKARINTPKVYHLDQVMDLAKKFRTRELPGNYPFTVKGMLITEAVMTWKQLANKCFEEVQALVTENLTDLIDDHFQNQISGGLHAAVISITRQCIQHRYQVTREKIGSLCDSEKTPYTQNEDYFFSHRTKLLGRYKAIYRQSRGQQGVVTALQKYATGVRDNQWTNINQVLAYLPNIGITGLVAEDLAKLLPEDGMGPALDIMAEVRAYFQVAYKRFSDNIPKQIDMDFVRGTDRDLDLALRAMDLSEKKCLEWLEEDWSVTQKRGGLLGKKRRLELAKEKLGSVVHSHGVAF